MVMVTTTAAQASHKVEFRSERLKMKCHTCWHNYSTRENSQQDSNLEMRAAINTAAVRSVSPPICVRALAMFRFVFVVGMGFSSKPFPAPSSLVC